MATWKNININKQNIKADTGKAILIAMPHNSKYDGYCFWHTTKLVKEGRHSYSVSIGYTDDFTFNLKKFGNGKWNSHDVIAEKTISVLEFEEAFGVMDNNIEKPLPPRNEFETHTPQGKEVVPVEIEEELKDE